MTYISVSQFAESLGISKTRVYALMESGKLPYDQFGKVRLIKKSEVLRWSPDKEDKRRKVKRIACFVLLSVLLQVAGYGGIDLSIVAQIESSGGLDKRAYDLSRSDIGLYQITKPCLDDYNNYNKTNYKKGDLLNDEINTKIAKWYLEVRIPQLLKHYGLPDNTENVLYAWNSGIGNLIKGNVNKGYVVRYNKLRGGSYESTNG